MIIYISFKIYGWKLGVVAHVCHVSTLGGQGRGITWNQKFKTNLANMVKPWLYKNIKISWAWWWVPVIPATWEAEAGESLEPGRWRLQWAEIASLHSSLGNKNKTLSQKKPKGKIIRSFSSYPYLSDPSFPLWPSFSCNLSTPNTLCTNVCVCW